MPKLTHERVNPFELMSLSSISQINRRHYKNVEGFRDDYSSYILINTWLNMLADIDPVHVTHVQRMLYNSGIQNTIHIAVEVSDALIHRKTLPNNYFSAIAQKMCSDNENVECFRRCLQILRFPKRYTTHVYPNSPIISEHIATFHRVNNRMKMVNRRGVPYWLEKSMKEHGAAFFNGLKVGNEFSIPSGSSCDAGRSLPSKVKSFEEMIGSFSPIIPSPHRGALGIRRFSRDMAKFRSSLEGYNYSKAIFVPKSYKAYRLIASEECYRQTIMSKYDKALRERLETCKARVFPTAGIITLDDQQRNRDLAKRASLDGSLSTIDLSSASDSISYRIVRDFVPSYWFRVFAQLRADKMILGDKAVTLHMFSTMGSRLTFPLETLCFWSIVVSAAELCRSFGISVDLQDCTVYGDDIIVPTVMAQTVIDLLGFYGFTVNLEKSFTDSTGLYRESCGDEYFGGYELSSNYFPRHEFIDDAQGWLYLIQLQHRIIEFPKADAFISTHLLSRIPKLTTGEVGSRYDELWSLYPEERIVKTLCVSDCDGVTHEFHKIAHTQFCYEYPLRREYSKQNTKDLAMETVDRYRYYNFQNYGSKYDDYLLEVLKIPSDDGTTAIHSLGDPQGRFRTRNVWE